VKKQKAKDKGQKAKMQSGGILISALQFSQKITAAGLAFVLCCAFFSCSLTRRDSSRTVVTFWHGMESGVNNQILQLKIDEFNARHPDIFVDGQVYGAADQLGPKLDAAVAGKTPPDLLWWSPAFFPKYADAGALKSIDEFIAQDKNFRRDDVYDYLWELGTFQGRIYITPFSANNLGIYYNKRLLAEAGITQPPATWEEFREAARKLTRNGVFGFQIPIGSSEWTVWTWQCFLWQAGGEILSPDKTRAAFNSPAGVVALDYWRSLMKEQLANFSETDAGYKTESFLSGRIAMTINGPWNFADLKKQQQVEVGVFPLPRKERAATNIGGESLFLFQSNPQRERAAWEFMKFVMSADFQVDWAINTGYLPVAKSAANAPKYQAFLRDNPFIKAYNDQMPDGRTRPSIPRYPALSAVLGKYLEAALYDKYSSQEALEKAAAEVNRLLR
jgi:multiple sugar transport system substrate-binding protein